MPSFQALTSTLRRRAKQNTLEVEHLLAIAHTGDRAFVPVIRSLEIEHNWSRERPVEGQRIGAIPFGLWADVVCRYLEDGADGVVALGTSPDTRTQYASFCLGLLETINTSDSVTAVLEVCGPLADRPDDDLPLALQCATALNLMLSFNGAPAILESLRSRVRSFLHKLMALNLANPQRGVVICGLRGAGDESSIGLINAGPHLTDGWSGLERQAIEAIRKRLRASGSKPK